MRSKLVMIEINMNIVCRCVNGTVHVQFDYYRCPYPPVGNENSNQFMIGIQVNNPLIQAWTAFRITFVRNLCYIKTINHFPSIILFSDTDKET